eukprot:COSAG02_NODE_2427_length_8886_cov_8.409469_4_plen_87_part_00
MGAHTQGAAQEREKAALVSQLETKLQGKIAHCKSFSEILTVLCGASISGSEILSPYLHLLQHLETKLITIVNCSLHRYQRGSVKGL